MTEWNAEYDLLHIPFNISAYLSSVKLMVKFKITLNKLILKVVISYLKTRKKDRQWHLKKRKRFIHKVYPVRALKKEIYLICMRTHNKSYGKYSAWKKEKKYKNTKRKFYIYSQI